jgi:cytochrome c
MDFLSDIVISPGEQQISLHRYLTILVLFLHLPFAGMLIGSALLSVLINLFHLQNPSENFSRFAREMLDHTLSRKMAALVLGVLPLLSLVLLNVQWFADITPPLLEYLTGAVALIILGFILLAVYRGGFDRSGIPVGRPASLPQILPGAAGVGLLFVGYFFLLSSLTLLDHPGKWAFIDGPLDLIVTWNSIWRFAQFIMLCFVLAGIGILFFFFRWPGKNVDANTNYGRLAKYFAAGTSLAAVAAIPLITFFRHVTSPVVAMSVAVYAVWIVVLLLLAIVCMYLLAILRSGNTRYGTHVFIVFLIALLGLITGDQLAMENATKEHTLQLKEKAEAVRAEREEARQIVMAKSFLGPEEGKNLYEAKCTACHEFDKKLVGPPHREVIPKYKGNIDGLAAFIKNPTKVNPDYPPMPNLGLSAREARAVAEYLMGEILGEE